jgi:membrane fusion protein (multidrug efflux system)
MLKWFPVLAGVLGLVWFWAGPESVDEGLQFGGRATPVSAAVVQRSEFADAVIAVGTLEAWESVDIRPSVAQIVNELLFEDGDSVNAGQVLARQKQDAEKARFSELSASLVDAEREVERLSNLATKNQVAQTDLDRATTRVQVLEFQLDEVRARIQDRTIIAPFSGQLGLREVSPGALITPTTRIVTLDDVSRMRLTFSVPAVELGVLSLGQRVTARSAAFPESFVGTISAIDSRVDPVTRSIQVRAEVPNPEGRLRPGLLMNTRVEANPRMAVVIPEEAIESRGKEHFVWVMESADTARKSRVSIGGRSAGFVEIVDGLNEGQKIVVDGVGLLRMSPAKVKPKE